MSYKNYKRHLGKIELNKESVERNRIAFFEFYFNYFYNIVVNYFTWEGLPNDIDELFIERKLIENGHVSFFHDDTFGFIAQGGTRGERLNHYDQPLSYQPVNASSMNYFKQMEIAYTENDFRVIEDLHKDNPDKIKKPCIVIPNNNFYEPYIGYLELFCEKLADIELTILIGQYAQKYYLHQKGNIKLTETVQHYQDYLPDFFPLVHPSPRNQIWMAKNPWFEAEVVPELQALVQKIIHQ